MQGCQGIGFLNIGNIRSGPVLGRYTFMDSIVLITVGYLSFLSACAGVSVVSSIVKTIATG